MGIKGAFSLLESEPSRFGRPWHLSSIEDIDLHVYVDGPALHHHLVAAWLDEFRQGYSIRSTSSDPNTHDASIVYTRHRPNIPVEASIWSNELPWFSPTIISPRVLHKLTYSFLLTLFYSGAREVHIVWDGPASSFKRDAQIQRLESQCHNCYRLARRFTNCNELNRDHLSGLHPTLHLWGESIMQEAVHDLQLSMERERKKQRLLNHSADTEAEIFMGHLFHNAMRETGNMHRVVVLSNDSDLLVYNSIPGFIPLSTLIFQITSSTTSNSDTNAYHLTGWMYTQEQLFLAFPFLHPTCWSNRSDSSSSSTIIATELRDYAACNYRMVVIAALAGCDYTLDPLLEQSLNEMRNTIVKSDVGGLRLRDRNNPTSKKTLIAILRYMSHVLNASNIDESLGASECMTLLGMAVVNFVRRAEVKKSSCKKWNSHGRGVPEISTLHFIQALIDICAIYHPQCQLPIVSPDVNIRRILDQRVFYCKPLIELHHGGESIWMEPIFSSCRKRLYSVLAFISKQSNAFSIVEYVHVRQGKHDLYRRSSVDFTETKASLESNTGTHSHFVEFMLGSTQLHRTPIEDPGILYIYASLLLNTCEEKFLLLAAAFIASYCTEHWQRMGIIDPQESFTSTDDKSIFLNVYNHLQVALFHANLACGIIALLPHHAIGSSQIHLNRFFIDEILIMSLWKRIEEGRYHFENWGWYRESSRDLLFDIICDTLQSPKDSQLHMIFFKWWIVWFGRDDDM